MARPSCIHAVISGVHKAAGTRFPYTLRPKSLKSIPAIKITASAEQVARLWAKEQGYKLVPQGLEEAYRLGLQTQAPIRKVFWTNGPSREFKVGNDKVVVKSVGKNLLRWMNRPEGALLRALIVMMKYEITATLLKTAFKRLNIAENQLSPMLNKLANSQVVKATNQFLHRLEGMVLIIIDNPHYMTTLGPF